MYLIACQFVWHGIWFSRDNARFSFSFCTEKRTQTLIVPVGSSSFSSSWSSAVTEDSVVLFDKTSEVVNDGCVVVEMFPGKIVKSMLISSPAERKNVNEQFSPHWLRTLSTDISTVKFKRENKLSQNLVSVRFFALVSQSHNCPLVCRTLYTVCVVQDMVKPNNWICLEL